jgi:hypothetical protein
VSEKRSMETMWKVWLMSTGDWRGMMSRNRRSRDQTGRESKFEIARKGRKAKALEFVRGANRLREGVGRT